MTTVLVLTVLAALLGGAVCFAVAVPARRAALPSRFLVAALVGVVVGELIAMLALNGPIETRLRDDADRAAAGAPAVRTAQGELDAAIADRTALDTRVGEAAARRDDALTVARCEYRPGPACPQTSITGVAGQGPETRTANQRLAAAQTDLDRATAARASRTPAADARVTRARADVDVARETVTAADPGVGARWAAMNGVTGSSASALALRLGIVAICIALALLPLLLRLWRGETVRDVRARQVLESQRIASAAQLAIDRTEQERRVALALAPPPAVPQSPVEALGAAGFEPVEVSARRYVRAVPEGRPAAVGPETEDEFLPIAAAAEAASLAPRATPDRSVPRRQPPADERPTGPIAVAAPSPDPTGSEARPEPAEEATVTDEKNLPAVAGARSPAAEEAGEVERRDVGQRDTDRKPNPFVPPVLDDAARVVAGFVRPLMPPIVARVLPGPATRTVQQSYEEVEEVTFSMRRTRRVTVGTSEQTAPAGLVAAAPPDDAARAGGHRVTAQVGAPAGEEPLDVAHEEIAGADRRRLPGSEPRELR